MRSCSPGWRSGCHVPGSELVCAIEGQYLGGVANSSLDSLLQSFFVTAGDVHYGPIALESLGNNEAEARATFSRYNQSTMITLSRSASMETNLQ